MPLAPLDLPALDADWVAFVADQVSRGWRTARGVVARLKDGTGRSALEVLDLWTTATSPWVSRGAGGLLPGPPRGLPCGPAPRCPRRRVAAFATRRSVDRELYDVLANLDADRAGSGGLDDEASGCST